MLLISFLLKTCKPIQNPLIHQLQKSNCWKSQISNYRYEIQINKKKKNHAIPTCLKTSPKPNKSKNVLLIINTL